MSSATISTMLGRRWPASASRAATENNATTTAIIKGTHFATFAPAFFSPLLKGRPRPVEPGRPAIMISAEDARMASLIVTGGPGVDSYYPLGRRTMVVGRDEGLPAQLLDPHVSRKHF